jgi:hypothetical protein
MTPPTRIRTQSDLHDAWRQLMEPLGFSGHSVWLMLIEADDRTVPHLTQIEDAQQPPGPVQREGFAEMLRSLVDDLVPGGRVAFLRSRPGGGGLTPDDRAWARGLYETGRQAGVEVEVVHRACDVDLVPVPMDEALAEPA